MRGYVPPRTEDQEVDQWSGRVPRLCCQDAEDTWVDVIHRDGSHIHKFREIIFVGHLINSQLYLGVSCLRVISESSDY